MQPLPEDAEANFTRRHVLHQVQHVVVPEEIGGLERGGLQPLPEGVAVLQSDAEKVARAANGPRSRLECRQGCGVVFRVGERRKRASELVVFPGLFPHRPHDLHHLPMGDPLPARPFALLPLGAGDRLFHAALDPGLGPDGNVGLHAALPEGEATVQVGRVHGAPDPVLVAAHVAIGHRDGVYVGIAEIGIPRQGVGDAVDVVPAPRVVADEMRAERGTDLHELEAGLELLDEDVHLDGSRGQAEVPFQRREDVAPQGGLFGRLYLGEVEDDGRAGPP